MGCGHLHMGIYISGIYIWAFTFRAFAYGHLHFGHLHMGIFRFLLGYPICNQSPASTSPQRGWWVSNRGARGGEWRGRVHLPILFHPLGCAGGRVLAPFFPLPSGCGASILGLFTSSTTVGHNAHVLGSGFFGFDVRELSITLVEHLSHFLMETIECPLDVLVVGAEVVFGAQLVSRGIFLVFGVEELETVHGLVLCQMG
jgi:hypothetical protein